MGLVNHPLPPSNLDQRSLPLVSISTPLFRTYDGNYQPLYFGRLRRHRFDAPASEYGVLYCGSDLHCAFVETFGHATGIGVVSLDELRRRGTARIVIRSALRLVDLTGPGLTQIGADNYLCTGDCNIAQQWSLALHKHPECPDGVYYRPRHYPSRFSAAIFDPAESLLTAIPLGTLADSRHIVLLSDILDTYKFGLIGT
jgi:hypothetical protein